MTEPDSDPTIRPKKRFWVSLPGILAQVAVVIVAITGLIVALDGNGDGGSTTTTAPSRDTSTSPPDTSTTTDDEEIVLQAEDGALIAPMTANPDETASRGFFVSSPEQGEGGVRLEFTAQGGTYTIWGLVRADSAGPTSSNSFTVSIDGGGEDIWDFFESRGNPPTFWSWDAISLRCGGTFENHGCNPQFWELEPGPHWIDIITRDSDAGLDVILITTDLDAQPPFGP